MPDPLFRGVGVALVTLFDDDGRLLVEATCEHAADLVARGMSAVVVSGSTGESWALGVDERLELTAAVVDALGGRVPVVVGAGHLDDADATRLVAAAGESGAAAVLALSPTGVDDVRPHYEALAAASSVALLAYHFPAISPPGIALDQLVALPVVGCKDSSGDAGRLVEELAAFDRPIYVGSSAYLALAGPIGATGAILSLANTDPEDCIAAFAGDLAVQRALLPAHRETRADFPVGLKARLARLRGTPTGIRGHALARR